MEYAATSHHGGRNRDLRDLEKRLEFLENERSLLGDETPDRLTAAERQSLATVERQLVDVRGRLAALRRIPSP